MIARSRPCVFIACSQSLYLDVNPRTGSIKLNFPDLEPWEIAESCSIDAADRGGETLDVVAARMNLTRERVRQIEEVAMRKLAGCAKLEELSEVGTEQEE